MKPTWPQNLGERSEYQSVEAQSNCIESHRADDIASTWVETREGARVPFALKLSLVPKGDRPPTMGEPRQRHKTADIRGDSGFS
jgi:hypothetical protein